ncbi:hypothetical protein HDV02_006525 [Globomyces sp. JEL0801]|nr:hypothetical protein HDV02_006525 [Globomyces sp. JEL0801]
MMEDFFPYYDPVLYPKVENFSDWFDYTSGRIKGKTEQLDIHMELPEHWISILKSTGMLPAWDTVSCIQTSKSYLENEEPGPLLSKIEFIGLNESEQINQFNNLKVADTDLFKEDQQLDIPLKQSLEEFYSKNCSVDLDDISKINSGYPGSDSIVQKLVIPPQQLQTYQTILKNSTKIQGDMFKNRLFEKLKKDWIITKNIHLEINDRMDGDVHLLLVDRDIVPSLSHLLKSNNWESQEIANLLK